MTVAKLIHSEKLKQIAKIYKVKRLALFGSYLHQTQHKHSDVDLLAEFYPEADLLDMVGLKQDLEGILKKKVDIVTKNSISKYLKLRILKEAVYL